MKNVDPAVLTAETFPYNSKCVVHNLPDDVLNVGGDVEPSHHEIEAKSSINGWTNNQE